MIRGKDSNEITKNIFGIFLRNFPKKKNVWIQQYYFGRKQKYHVYQLMTQFYLGPKATLAADLA